MQHGKPNPDDWQENLAFSLTAKSRLRHECDCVVVFSGNFGQFRTALFA